MSVQSNGESKLDPATPMPKLAKCRRAPRHPISKAMLRLPHTSGTQTAEAESKILDFSIY
jgi:hypothetical protein